MQQQHYPQSYAMLLLALPSVTIFAFSDIGVGAGHSLGGAVATLSVLRLLKQLPQGATPTVRCVTFACPAIGNLALAEYVRSVGWEHLFQNYLIPGWLLIPPQRLRVSQLCLRSPSDIGNPAAGQRSLVTLTRIAEANAVFRGCLRQMETWRILGKMEGLLSFPKSYRGWGIADAVLSAVALNRRGASLCRGHRPPAAGVAGAVTGAGGCSSHCGAAAGGSRAHRRRVCGVHSRDV